MSVSDSNGNVGINGSNGKERREERPLDQAMEVPQLERKNTQRRVHLSLTRLPSGSRSEVPVTAVSKKLTREEIFTMASICSGNLCLGTLYALLAPFFPFEVIFPLSQTKLRATSFACDR